MHMRKCAFSDYKSQTDRNYIFSLFYAAIIEGTIKVRVEMCQAGSQSPSSHVCTWLREAPSPLSQRGRCKGFAMIKERPEQGLQGHLVKLGYTTGFRKMRPKK